MSKTFETWWEQSGQHWAAAVLENDGTLWTDSMDERRALFGRRHQRPEPPQGMAPIKSIRSYQQNYANDEPVQHDQLPIESAPAA